MIIDEHDAYTDRLTRFDLQAKIQTQQPVTLRDYLDNVKRCIYYWEQHEIDYIHQLIATTAEKIDRLGLSFHLPPEIWIIKSSMREEGRANGYTRQNAIFLNPRSLSGHLFEHELFHIISRFNESQQEKAYHLLGFIKCNEITLPAGYLPRKVTNPDAPLNNFYINVTYKGEDKEVVPTMFSYRDYAGASFFKYINKGLLVVAGPADNKQPVLVDDQPVIYAYESVGRFFEQIGKNTGYNIHQEEVTADHFTLLLDPPASLPNPELIEGLAQVLRLA